MEKSWNEKLHDDKPHEVKTLPVNIAGMKKGQIVFIPTVQIVDKFIRAIPKGKSVDVKTLRAKMAKRYKAEVTCSATMGFHLRTVAEAAYEDYEQGADVKEITPYWRVLNETR